MNTEIETASDLDALYEKSNAAHAAARASFEAWEKARQRQADIAIGIADRLVDGHAFIPATLDRYREACRLLREADVEDDRLRAIAKTASAELEAARAATR